MIIVLDYRKEKELVPLMVAFPEFQFSRFCFQTYLVILPSCILKEYLEIFDLGWRDPVKIVQITSLTLKVIFMLEIFGNAVDIS